MASAADASIARMRPAGTSLRRTFPCSIPGTVMSPTYRAAPHIFSSPSLRSIERPSPAPVSEGADGATLIAPAPGPRR